MKVSVFSPYRLLCRRCCSSGLPLSRPLVGAHGEVCLHQRIDVCTQRGHISSATAELRANVLKEAVALGGRVLAQRPLLCLPAHERGDLCAERAVRGRPEPELLESGREPVGEAL